MKPARRPLLPLLLLVLGGLLGACAYQPNDPQPAAPTLPPISQSGSNTFGFRVDGEVWTPAGNDALPAYQGHYDQQVFWIVANQYTRTTREELGIHVESLPPGTTAHDLAAQDGVVAYFNTLTDEYQVVDPGAGTLHLTRLDTVQHIVSGTFEFDAVSATTGQTVHITDGRFDLRTD